MDMDLIPTLINYSQNPQFYETEGVTEATYLDELADALLGDDLLNIPSNTLDPEWDFGYDLVNQFITTPSYNSASSDDNNNNNNNDESVECLVGSGVVVQEQPRRSKKRKVETEKKQLAVNNGGNARRKRDPNQVQDHIVAERKRREVHSHMFITLSSMIPGLKKIDKTTILRDAIKHIKQLQEKVKQLELTVAQRNTTTNKSMVVVKKYQLPMMDDNDDDDDNGSSSVLVDDDTSGGSGANGGSNNNNADCYYVTHRNKNSSSLPEIEVRKSDNKLLLKINCEKHEGVVSELITAVERHDLSITSSVVIPFDNFTLDITIIAQLEEGFNNNVKGLVRTLCSVLGSTSP